MCYTSCMKNSIAQKNKYLNGSQKIEEAARRIATTSTSVEGVHIDRYKVTIKKLSSKPYSNSKWSFDNRAEYRFHGFVVSHLSCSYSRKVIL